jgi:pimeloyl-ACP methyl ester carboxylesterase
MARAGWEDDYPSIRDHFAAVLAPDASTQDQRAYAQAMRETITATEFARFRETVGRLKVTDLLPRLRCPALVLHATGDRMHPISQGRDFAAAIPGSRFIALPSRNHVMPDYDPAWPVALREIRGFLTAVASG